MAALRTWAAAAVVALVLVLPAFAAAGPPPSIGDLDGSAWGVAWAHKVSGTGYYLMGGGKEKISGGGWFWITQVNVDVVRLDVEGGDSFYGRYYSDSGVLVVGSLNDTELATQARCGYFIFSGTPGKLKARGEIMEYDIVSDGEAEVIKISAKQQAAPK